MDTGVVHANYSREEMVWTVDSKTEMLATWAMLCVGAVAVVTTNIAVELRVANGTKVIIREVVPHPNGIYGRDQNTEPGRAIIAITYMHICRIDRGE
jgi:hypothetical protein